MADINERKVFISYSWEKEETKNMAMALALELNKHKYINVVLDRWHLSPGDDKYVFMEESVSNSDYVFLLLDEAYQKKADNREGGVGDETTLITTNIYRESIQSKFLPLIMERNENGEVFAPNYLQSRLYIDLSNELEFEEKLEEIFRHIYNKPKDEMPPSGDFVPDFLDEDSNEEVQESDPDPNKKLKKLNDKIDSASETNPKRVKRLKDEFIKEFFNQLDDLIVTEKEYEDSQDRATLMYEKMKETKRIQEEFIQFITLLDEANYLEADFIIEFIEYFSLYLYSSNEKYNNSSSYEPQFDQFKFLLHELFLYITATLLRSKKYNELNRLVKQEYILNPYREVIRSFSKIRPVLSSLDDRHLKGNRASIHTDLLLERATNDWKKFIIETDIFLYIVSKFQNVYEDHPRFSTWFPMVSLYEFKSREKNRYVSNLKFKDYFHNVKQLFDVDSKDEFISKHEDQDWNEKAGSFVTIPNVETFISLDEIATK